MPLRRTRHVLSLAAAATAPLLIGVADASATVIVRNVKAGNVTPPALSRVPGSISTSGATTAYPAVTPINGFQPHVVIGLTNENENDMFSPKSSAPLSAMSGSSVVPNPAQNFIALLDTGAQMSILGRDDADAINLFANGLEGPNTVDAIGVSGVEELFVSDALGLYMSGLQNATPGANGPVVPQNTLKGMWNTSVLSAWEETSVLPTLIGNPMAAHWQIVMRNSQTQRFTVNGKTYQTPSVTMNNIGTPHDNSFVEVTLTPMSPGGANSAPLFVPDFFGSTDGWEDDPTQPTVWNALMANVKVQNDTSDQITRPFLFDTGAQVTVISTETATSLGINTGGSNPTPVDFTAEVLGVGGITIVNGYYIDELTIETNGIDLVKQNVPVLLLDVDDPSDGQDAVPGIIGMNLLNDRDVIVNAKIGTGSYLAFSEFAIQAKWNVNASGDWGSNANWMRGVPWLPGEEANFTSAITAPKTINVEADYTFGHMKFDNANRYTISGTGKLTLMENVGRTSIQVNSGSHTVNTDVELASDTEAIIIPAASTLTMSGVVNSANGSALIKTGQGTLQLTRMQNLGELDVQAGVVEMRPPTALGAFARTSSVDTVSIGAAAAKLDLSRGNLIVRNTPTGTWDGAGYTGVQGLVHSGHNAGTWDGVGGIITSAADAAAGLTSLGVARAADVLGIDLSETGTWAGHEVTGASTIVMYTYAGDANLDGFISGDDYAAIDFSMAVPNASGWYNGDFNYDGIISGDDYAAIDFNIVAQGAPFATSGGGAEGLSAVPEPTACGIALLATPLMLARRRRQGLSSILNRA